MKKLLLSVGLILALSSAAHAKTPPEVMKPYKAYAAAVKANDAASARKHAYEAWQKAEELMGDSKVTGDLALNYAMVINEGDKKIKKKQKQAFERSLALTSFQKDPVLAYMERGVSFMNFKQVDNVRSAFDLSRKLEKYAEQNNLTTSTFYGEVLTLQAGYYASRGKHETAEAVAKKALESFSNRTDRFQTIQPILANLYKGYGLEGQQKPVEAALSYQKVMEALDGIHPDEHPLAAKALGRWSQMRGVLHSQGKLEEAEAQGLCQCWPYDKPRNEEVQPIKRVPPVMPRNAFVSGFTIVEFDLDDTGKPVDENILVSWPEGIYEKSSIKSLKQWEYTPRTDDQSDEDRQNIVATITYRLTDERGNLLY